MPKWMLGRLAAGVLGGAAATLAVFTVVRYQTDMRDAAEHIAGMGSQVMETKCGPIEYAVRGSGYPVLVVHGNGGGFDHGLALGQGYLGEGFQIIAPSRFGYLRTPLPAGATPALQADAFACLLDALHIERAALLASSAGSTAALQFALRHPQRLSGLVLHSPNAPGAVEMALPPRPLLNAIFHSDAAWWFLSTQLRTQAQHFVGVPAGFVLTPEQAAAVHAVLAQVSPISRRGDGMLFDTFFGNPAINSCPLAQVTAPVLVISAQDDPMALHANARRLAEQVPGARLLAIGDGGHLLLGHDVEVKAAVTQFVRETQ